MQAALAQPPERKMRKMSRKKITLEDIDKRLRQGVSVIDLGDILKQMSGTRVSLRLIRENPELFDDIMRRIDKALQLA